MKHDDLANAGRHNVVVPARGSWTRRVTILAERAREAISAHTAVVPLLLTHRHATEGSLRWTEAMLRALAEAGVDGKQRANAQRTLVSYVIGAVQLEHVGPLAGPGTAALAQLPPTQYPYLAETAVHAQHIPPDEEFRRGLGVVLRGLSADFR